MTSTTDLLQTFRNLLSSASNDSTHIYQGQTIQLSVVDDLRNRIWKVYRQVYKDEYLMRFLRFKSDPQRAYEMLVKYHSFRKRGKNLFARMRPYALKPLIDSKIITKLSGNDAKGNQVSLVTFRRWNEKLYSVEDVMLLMMLFSEELIRTKASHVAVLFDWEGHGSSYCELFKKLKKNILPAKGAFPISYKGIHQVNEARVRDKLCNMMRTLFSTKLKKRIHDHGTNREPLAAHIPFSTLPVDYGGTSKQDVDTDFINEMYKHEQYYEALANFH